MKMRLKLGSVLLGIITFSNVFYTCKASRAAGCRRRATTGKLNMTTRSEALEIIFKGYDKHVRPYSQEGKPVNITVNMRINSVYEVHEEEMDYTMRFAFRQKWTDPRLKYNVELTRGKGHPYMQLESANRIWYPDTFFMNARSAFIHDVTKRNLGVRVFPDGSIYMSQKITVTAECQMDLRKFPMDTQVCTLMFESFFHTAAEIVFKWENTDKPVAISKDMNLPHFDIVALETKEVNNVYKSGKFNSLEVHITFQRRLGFYIIQIYLPCVFLVFLSWMPFWMDPGETGDRLAVGITAVLTLVFLSGAMNNKMPKVSYMKAIDWYVIACFLAMVLSFVESMAVFRAGEHNQKKEAKDAEDWGVPLTKRIIDNSNECYDMKEMMSDETELTAENGPVRDRRPRLIRLQSLAKTTLRGACNKKTPKKKGHHKIDRISHILFPGIFIAFNVIYWLIYMS
ncbi:gamma-aminobutyric acid receptor subunit beta-3 [Exaiptasia diaphana]|uniref:Gamma-aminobutyric acid receptor subunit beta n=1 Tax=Exaiptasia diaphana TaxID=2652724 RepID=A0A913Y3Y6_EXADI|nr:gamma-aminobutyric acid receptor subunit beta-3 [Exaiptasia diaphana]